MTIAELPSVVAELPPFVLDPTAEPPFSKCRKLASWYPKFRQSLDGITDESPAERDLSLASITAMGGWPDQEIVNLLVACRRDKGSRPMEENHYARIIVQARAPIAQAAAQERFETNDGKDRAEKLADLSAMLGLGLGAQILDLVKHAGDPPDYWMDTSGGSITLGRSENILTQRLFGYAVAATTGRVLTRCKAVEWHKRVQAILLCCRDVDMLDASHPALEVAQWLEDYLDSQTILDDPDVACRQHLPFRREDGAVLFILDNFRQYVHFHMGAQLSTRKLAHWLALGGVTPTHINYDRPNVGRSTRNYWIHIKKSISHLDGYKTSVIPLYG